MWMLLAELILKIVGVGISLLFLGFGILRYFQKKKDLKDANSNLQAAKEAKKAKNDINLLSNTELDRRLSDRMRERKKRVRDI